ncbi:hypothetical protein BpHYR1_033944, partial [Brachionus plicatilis]
NFWFVWANRIIEIRLIACVKYWRTSSLKVSSNFSTSFDQHNYVCSSIESVVNGKRCFNWKLVTSHILAIENTKISNLVY